MSLLRPVSIFLRNFLVKQHPYFSCCASCGEIKIPLQGRLCASLSPDFPVDAIILPPLRGPADLQTALLIRNQAPWLRHIILLCRDGAAKAPERSGIMPASPEELPAPPLPGLPLEAMLHEMRELAEYFLVLAPGASFSRKQHPLDFFTPNGIPLLAPGRLPADEGWTRADTAEAASVYPQTREMAARFLAALAAPGGAPRVSPEADAPEAAYRNGLARWAYAEGLAIVSPHAGPMLR